MPTETDLSALTKKEEERRLQRPPAPRRTEPPATLPKQSQNWKRRRKKKKRVQECPPDDEFYSESEDVATLELRLAFREADRLKRQVAFWKSKCERHLPEYVDHWEDEEREMLRNPARFDADRDQCSDDDLPSAPKNDTAEQFQLSAPTFVPSWNTLPGVLQTQ
jgi:hypothetical protein